MHAAGPNNPLHGITLAMMLDTLVDHYGWEQLGYLIPINCFTSNPSTKSSLVFLRRTPWARAKVEGLYLHYRATLKWNATEQSPEAPETADTPETTPEAAPEQAPEATPD